MTPSSQWPTTREFRTGGEFGSRGCKPRDAYRPAVAGAGRRALRRRLVLRGTVGRASDGRVVAQWKVTSRTGGAETYRTGSGETRLAPARASEPAPSLSRVYAAARNGHSGASRTGATWRSLGISREDHVAPRAGDDHELGHLRRRDERRLGGQRDRRRGGEAQQHAVRRRPAACRPCESILSSRIFAASPHMPVSSQADAPPRPASACRARYCRSAAPGRQGMESPRHQDVRIVDPHPGAPQRGAAVRDERACGTPCAAGQPTPGTGGRSRNSAKTARRRAGPRPSAPRRFARCRRPRRPRRPLPVCAWSAVGSAAAVPEAWLVVHSHVVQATVACRSADATEVHV